MSCYTQFSPITPQILLFADDARDSKVFTPIAIIFKLNSAASNKRVPFVPSMMLHRPTSSSQDNKRSPSPPLDPPRETPCTKLQSHIFGPQPSFQLLLYLYPLAHANPESTLEMAPKKLPTYSRTTLANLKTLATARDVAAHGTKIDIISRLVKQDYEQELENKRIDAEVRAATTSRGNVGGRAGNGNSCGLTESTRRQPRAAESNRAGKGSNSKKNGWRDAARRTVVTGSTERSEQHPPNDQNRNHDTATTDTIIHSLMTRGIVEPTHPPSNDPRTTTTTLSTTTKHSTPSTRKRTLHPNPPPNLPNTFSTPYGPLSIPPTTHPKKPHHNTWISQRQRPFSTTSLSHSHTTQHLQESSGGKQRRDVETTGGDVAGEIAISAAALLVSVGATVWGLLVLRAVFLVVLEA